MFQKTAVSSLFIMSLCLTQAVYAAGSDRFVLPAPAPVAPAVSAEDQSAIVCKAMIDSLLDFDVVHAKRYADRVHQVGLPMHRLSTFAYSLRTQAWLEAVNTESSSRDAAFEVLMLAAQVLNEYEASGVVTSVEEVRLAADLESALINAYKTIQVVCSARSNARIDQAFIKLEEARPWWWFNSARGERDAGRVAVPVQRDRELADLLSGTRLDEFIGEATKGLSAEDRAGYLRQTGLSIVKPQYEDLIPESNRVWDASMLIIDEPIDAKPHTRNFRGGR